VCVLSNYDLSQRLSKSQEAELLSVEQRRLVMLRLIDGGIFDGSGLLGPPICVVFEGWDASGKGGAIRRLVSPLDPRHVRVASIAAPTENEKRHHFLSRFWPVLPGWGGMAVLDRSWYGRVLVERVEGFATEEQWRRAYEEIKAFERTLTDEGMVLIKFWMHISPEEQLRRFHAREKNLLKRWKLTDEDWRNRHKWQQYEDAVNEMVERTDTSYAPWTVVEAEDKRFARVKVLQTVTGRVAKALLDNGLDVPPQAIPPELLADQSASDDQDGR
jgi:polyphosphate kinase 2 (PPK2 family)